ncbi:MAG: TFIIB-type zinc ribbon-containing protein, partial [Candidatus Hodarchaeota archaeon]
MDSQKPGRICPECQSTSLVLDPTTSEIICANCGIVLEIQLETGPEWRSFSESLSSRDRAGPPITPLSSSGGLRTYLTPSMKDAQGKSL